MKFKFKSLALAIGITTGSISIPVLAFPITTVVTSSTDVSYNGAFASDSDGPSSAVLSESYLYDTSTSSPWYFGNAEGVASGTSTGLSFLFSKASGAKSASTSNVHQIATITNDTASAQNFSFDFLINSGSLSTSIINYEIGAGHYENASYSANILVNGKSVWSSSANLNFDSNGFKLVKSGVDIGIQSFGENDHWYGAGWGVFEGHLDLGTFAAGKTFTLDYFFTTSTKANLNPLEVDSGYGAFAGFGDPWSLNASPINNDTIQISTPTVSVPEPAGLAILGTGLLGLAYRRRLKQKN